MTARSGRCSSFKLLVPQRGVRGDAVNNRRRHVRSARGHTPETLAALLHRHRPDDSVNRAIQKLIRADLICLDDVGLLPVSADAAEAMFRVIDAAYERRSVALSSNLHPSGFDELMPKRSRPRPLNGCYTTPTC